VGFTIENPIELTLEISAEDFRSFLEELLPM